MKRVFALLGVAVVFGAAAACAQTPDNGNLAPADTGVPYAQDTQAAPITRQAPGAGQADPPSRVARLSVLEGNVSVEPASVDQFSAAELNQVFTTGDRLYTDASAQAELQSGQVAVRMGGGTDLTLTAITDQVVQFGIASGSVHVRSYGMSADSVLEVDSPEAALTVLQAGDVRVDEDPAAHTTTVSVIAGQVQIDGPQISQQVNAGERVRIHAGDAGTGQPAYAEPVSAEGSDALDGFSDGRDNLYANGAQGSADYLNADTTGGADLAANGTWDTDAEIGPVWYPVVAVGWRPYTYGHWRWVAPWGWTWVGAEAWGFAPFHYGRWAFLGGRWGWVPGTPSVRPVYAPALVAFVGGQRLSGAPGTEAGAGLAAWFPLGPREPYTPPYRGSTLYVNRVNVSNLSTRNTAEAQAFFNQRVANVYASDSLTSRGYVNRERGTVAVSQASFAGGQPVSRNLLHVPESQLAQAPVLARPLAGPERTTVQASPARALPPSDRATSVFVNGVHPVARPGASDSLVQSARRPAFFRAPPSPGARPGFGEPRPGAAGAEAGRTLGPRQIENRPAGVAAGREAPRSSPPSPRPPAPPPAPAGAHR